MSQSPTKRAWDDCTLLEEGRTRSVSLEDEKCSAGTCDDRTAATTLIFASGNSQ